MADVVMFREVYTWEASDRQKGCTFYYERAPILVVVSIIANL
jgi:hypothetical protein